MVVVNVVTEKSILFYCPALIFAHFVLSLS